LLKPMIERTGGTAGRLGSGKPFRCEAVDSNCRARRVEGVFGFRRPIRRLSLLRYDGRMLRYHIAFYLPREFGEMVVAEALDFPGAVSQGFDLPDARLMIASAMEDLSQSLPEEGEPLPTRNPDATADADLIELVPLAVHAAHRV
jgi:predicted RNase H-like HicB family nuclease